MIRPIVSLATVCLALAGCRRSTEISEPPTAHFKTGHGVMLPEPMKKSLDLEISDVAEQSFVPRIEIPLHVIRTSQSPAPSTEAGGWISSDLADALRVDRSVEISTPDGPPVQGVVREIRSAAFSALGEREVVVIIQEAIPPGTPLTASVAGEATGDVVAVPKSAVMKTAEGHFVYVANEDYFMRTPVEIARSNDEVVEISDGLFAGDQVVTRKVTPLWMTELQALRAGQSCCAGH